MMGGTRGRVHPQEEGEGRRGESESRRSEEGQCVRVQLRGNGGHVVVRRHKRRRHVSPLRGGGDGDRSL